MPQRDNPFSGVQPDFPVTRETLKRNKGLVFLIIIVIIGILIAVNALYKVDEGKVAIVTRFGKYLEPPRMPGLNYKIPFVDTYYIYPAPQENLTQEFGFRTQEAGVKSTFRRNKFTTKEATVLTGDLNVSVVEWVVQYNIVDPVKYAFRVRNVTNTLRALAEATTRSVVGDYSDTEVLTRGRDEIIAKSLESLNQLCEAYETGIRVNNIEIRDVTVPDPVKPSFDEVNQAEQEMDRMLNEAWAQYNKEIPKARGVAEQLIQQAEGYAVERVNMAKGEVERFLAVQKEYQAAPTVTRTRLYLETMNHVLPKAGKKIYMDESTKNVVPMLFPLGASGAAGGAR